MSQGGTIDLDIGPAKRIGYQQSTNGHVHYTANSEGPKEYTSHKYAEYDKQPIEITGLFCSGKRITSFEPIRDVQNLFIYYKESRFLLLHVETEKRDFYYANQDYNVHITEAKFDKFVRGSNKKLKTGDLKSILDNIVTNEKLNYDALPSSIRNRLWRGTAVIFDLSKTPKDEGGGYNSDITNATITLIDSSPHGNLYKKVEHSTASPFYLKGLKKGHNIAVEGGLPTEPLKEFVVYYGKGDGTYEKPLLITLKVNPGSVIPGGVENYYLSKTKNSDRWDKLMLGRVDIGEGDDIKEILDSITKSDKLEVEKLKGGLPEKLKDLTKNLVINLKEKFDKKDGFYNSGGINITYTRTEHSTYATVRHAYNFQKFTVEKIETSLGDITSGHILPSKSAIVKNLSVFYSGKTTTDPWLISILYEGFQRLWLCRHNGDKNWLILRFWIPESDTDEKKIETLLKKLQIPNVTIDFSKPTSEPYTPDGSPSEFTVTDVPVTGLPGYYGLKHAMQGSGKFLLRKVIYRNIQLDGIRSLDPLESITAFFLKETTDKMEKLLLVELLTNGENKTYKYYLKETSGTKLWRELDRPAGDKDKKLDGKLLKITLDKQNCLHNHVHGIDLSKKNSVGYPCTIGCGTHVALRRGVVKGDYPQYTHYTPVQHGRFKIGSLVHNGQVLEGIPSNILFHRLRAYFSHRGRDAIPLLIRLQLYDPNVYVYYERKNGETKWTEYKITTDKSKISGDDLRIKLNELERMHIPPVVKIQIDERTDYPKSSPKEGYIVAVSTLDHSGDDLKGFTEHVHKLKDHEEFPFAIQSFYCNNIPTNINSENSVDKATQVSVFYSSELDAMSKDQGDRPLLVKVTRKLNDEGKTETSWFENDGKSKNEKWSKVEEKLEEGKKLKERLEGLVHKLKTTPEDEHKQKILSSESRESGLSGSDVSPVGDTGVTRMPSTSITEVSGPKGLEGKVPMTPPKKVPEVLSKSQETRESSVGVQSTSEEELIPEKKVPVPPPKKPEVPPVTVPEAPKEVVPEKKVPAVPPTSPRSEVSSVEVDSTRGDSVTGAVDGGNTTSDCSKDIWNIVGSLVSAGVYGSAIASIFGWYTLENILYLAFALFTPGESGLATTTSTGVPTVCSGSEEGISETGSEGATGAGGSADGAGGSGHNGASTPTGTTGGEGTVNVGNNSNDTSSFPWGTVIGSIAGVLGVIIIVFLIYRGRRVFSPSKRL